MRLKLCRVTAPYRLPDRVKSTAESIPAKVRTEGLGHETAVWTDACSSPSDASTGASLTVLNHRPEAKIGVRRSQHRTSAVMWPSRLVDTPTSQTGSSRMPRDAAISARV